MRIFAAPADDGGCGTYRIRLPARALAMRGHEVFIHSNLAAGLEREGQPFAITSDVIFTQRLHEPGVSEVWQRHLRTITRAKLVMDIDDDFLSLTPDNPVYPMWNDLDRRRRLRDNLRCADAITVTNHALAARISRLAPHARVSIHPNSLPGALRAVPSPATTSHGSQVWVGWAGSATHARDVGQLAYPLREVLHQFRHVRFISVGGTYPSFPPETVVLDWEDDYDAYMRTISSFDIGLAPLRVSRFNDCKSDIKILEYMGLGIPWIASNTGPYAQHKSLHNVAGILVNSLNEWCDALEKLIANPGLRQSMGEAGKRYAATRSIELAAVDYERLFERLSSNDRVKG